MKKTLLLILFILMGVTSVSMAVTVNMSSNQQATNKSITRFALSGVITRYLPSESLIVIDGKKYTLDGQGELNNTDLKAGSRIKYNAERSTQEKTGHVTKIWFDKENR